VGIKVVELERPDISVVAANGAAATCLCNKDAFYLAATLHDGCLSALAASIAAFGSTQEHRFAMSSAPQERSSRCFCSP
jgi:hypothetical protein